MFKFIKNCVIILFIITNFVFGTVCMAHTIFFPIFNFGILESYLGASCAYIVMTGLIIYIISTPENDEEDEDDEEAYIDI